MKALILAGGRGKRLNSDAGVGNKCMVEINDCPVIEYSLDHAMHDIIEEIIVIVGYRAEEIINRYGTSYKDKKISYVIQWDQRGLVHALECATKALDGHDFQLLLGDEVFVNPRHDVLIETFINEDAFAACGMIRVEDTSLISKTYSVLHDEKNVIHRLIEKPVNPLNNMMGTGSCIMKNEILNYIEVTPVHYLREEKELPDLLQCAIDDGKMIKMVEISSKYVNINMREDLLMARKLFDKEPS